MNLRTVMVVICALLINFALLQSGIITTLFMLLLVGVIPGTSYSISPNAMLVLHVSLMWTGFFYLLIRSKTTNASKKLVKKSKATRLEREPTASKRLRFIPQNLKA